MTTKQTRATERPWGISSSVIVVSEVGKVIAMPLVGIDSLELSLEERIANAELICKAVNAHDAMVLAVKKAKEVWAINNSADYQDIKEALDNALRLAGEEA